MASIVYVFLVAERLSLISDQLRAVILRSSLSRYRISKETGVSEAALSRFVRGERLLDLSSVDKLGQYLGLRLVKAAQGGKEQ